MGNAYTNIQKAIGEEYERVAGLNKTGSSRNYIVLDQVLKIQKTGWESFPIDFAHLGTLFVLDRNKSGKFELQDLLALGETCRSKEDLCKIKHEFQRQIQAYFALRMWSEVAREGGHQLFADWICELLGNNSTSAESKARLTFPSHPGRVFFSYDTIKTLHQILDIRTSYGYNYQDFFDLLQRSSEQENLMTLTDELDEYVPKETIHRFASNFIRGFTNVMLELGFDPEA
eukprot:TRINITY_DN2556_c0_g1_i1.p1 TRINITY_DN2556_c0_g1~~TRINITY_DN2556_c0_g1_i1.p1  ORF type:complete len:255 (+),score=82.43 TRINITY_DN2556_c0_g1_i1:78-767(+)